ncbi:MAG: YoaP domain-containing protein [Petrimonas sp.]
MSVHRLHPQQLRSLTDGSKSRLQTDDKTHFSVTPVKTVKIETKKQIQNHCVPFTKYSIFRDGKFVTHLILNDGYFNKFITM